MPVSSMTLSIEGASIAGQPRLLTDGGASWLPSQPLLFRLSFDRLHDRLHSCALAADIQLYIADGSRS